MTEPFVALVRERMRERGLGLRELCRLADVDPSFLSKVLAGKRNPPWEEEPLRRLAAALEVDAARLIVTAGRIPAEWSRIMTDGELLRSVHRLAAGASTPTPSPMVRAREKAFRPLERRRSDPETLSEELL